MPGDTFSRTTFSFFLLSLIFNTLLLCFCAEAGDTVPGPEKGVGIAFLFVLFIEEVVEGGVILGGVFRLKCIETKVLLVDGLLLFLRFYRSHRVGFEWCGAGGS